MYQAIYQIPKLVSRLSELALAKKTWGGFQNLLLIYNASKLSTLYVVKSPGFQRAPENSELAPFVLDLYALA